MAETQTCCSPSFLIPWCDLGSHRLRLAELSLTVAHERRCRAERHFLILLPARDSAGHILRHNWSCPSPWLPVFTHHKSVLWWLTQARRRWWPVVRGMRDCAARNDAKLNKPQNNSQIWSSATKKLDEQSSKQEMIVLSLLIKNSKLWTSVHKGKFLILTSISLASTCATTNLEISILSGMLIMERALY